MKERGQVPYTKSIKVYVVCSDPEKHYVNEAKEDKALINCVVGDETMAVKCTVYDRTKFGRFKEGASLIVRNVIKKVDSIVITANTKVFPTGKIEIPQSILEEGRNMLHPPAAAVTSVTAALSSPPRMRVSIQGKIVQEEATREVTVKNENVKVKNIFVEDNTSKCKVALWRSMTEEPLRAGDFVEITDVVTNTYRNEVSLQTTYRTTIKVIESPVEARALEILSGCKDEDGVTLLLQDDKIIQVPLEVIREAFPNVPDDGIEDKIQEMCSPTVTATCSLKNDVVLSIEFNA